MTGLQQAPAAWFGFWRPEGQEPVSYELRFYPSHEAAVEHGTALAEEVTGKDAAVLTSDDATWKEGARDRRAVGGYTGSARSAWGEIYARYGGFAIFGNVVMLCEGVNAAQSLERCGSLTRTLREASTD